MVFFCFVVKRDNAAMAGHPTPLTREYGCDSTNVSNCCAETQKAFWARSACPRTRKTTKRNEPLTDEEGQIDLPGGNSSLQALLSLR